MKKIFLLMIAGVVISLPIQGAKAKRKTVPESAQWQGQGERKEQLARDRAERAWGISTQKVEERAMARARREVARRAARRKREALLLRGARNGKGKESGRSARWQGENLPLRPADLVEDELEEGKSEY
jgi:hypothetical protein